MGGPVLVDLDDDADAPAPHARTGPVRWWWVALVVAVGLVLGVAQVLADARERARVAALADVPGVLDPLPAPPDVAWRLAEDATGDVEVVGSDVLVERVADDGAMVVTARDLVTGDVRWSVPVLDAPDPPLPPTAARYGLQCTDGPGVPGRVVCLAHDATAARRPGGGAAGSATATSAPATSASLVVVDAATGHERARYPAGRGATVAAAVGVVGGTLVLAAPLDDGTAVWAVDPVTGDERWRVRADTGFGGGWLRWGAQVRVVPVGDDAVAVLGAGAVLLDVADGGTLATAGTLATVLGARQDGTALVVGSEGYTRLVGADGQDVRLDGAPVPVVVDDGSAPGLALTTAGGLRAWDAATGEPRWRAVVPARVALVVGGYLHVHDGYRVTTLDAGTGEVLWEATAPEVVGADATVTALATDGTRLLVACSDTATAHAALAALDPRDGVVQWQASLTRLEPPAYVDAADGVLLGFSAQGTVVLR